MKPGPKGKRGAPFGNRNAFKHGKYTRERRALYAEIRAQIGRGRELMAAFGASPENARHPEGR